MPRLAILASLAALALGTAAASAQETGGVALTPEVMATDNAQGRVLDHVLARAQAFQQLRLLSAATPTSSNLANPGVSASNSGTQPIGPTPDQALALASALSQRAQMASNPALQQQIINNTQSLSISNTSQSLTVNNPLTVNALNSPVVLGNNNVVKQQVTSSTAITTNGNATASAGASSTSGAGGGSRKAKSGQNALSSATSLGGGVSHAVAINTEIAPEANH